MLQYRRSASLIFSAYIAFVLAGIGFEKMSEDVMKSSLPTVHPVFAITYVSIEVLAVLSLLAILVGGLPIALASLRFAMAHERRDILARFAVPPLALIVIVAYVFIANTLHLGKSFNLSIPSSWHLAGIGLIVIVIAGAGASTTAVLRAVALSDVTEQAMRFAIRPGVVASIAMLGMTAAAIIWNISFLQFDPALFWGNDGLLATSTLLSTILNIIVMVVASLVALLATVQGLGSSPTSAQIA